MKLKLHVKAGQGIFRKSKSLTRYSRVPVESRRKHIGRAVIDENRLDNIVKP